jgi:transcription initiation factor IIE alpha subunit
MSWIGGDFAIDDLKEKTLTNAQGRISSQVRHNADLEEFPHMGKNIMPIKRIAGDKIFDSYEEAEEYCEKKRDRWARNYNVTVAFYDTDVAKATKKMEDIEGRITKEQTKLKVYDETNNVSKFKANLISCPQCSSKVNKQYIRKNFCPVCRSDMRSVTVKNTIKKYHDNIKKFQKELAEERKKQKRKLPIRYLVCYEEYVG